MKPKPRRNAGLWFCRGRFAFSLVILSEVEESSVAKKVKYAPYGWMFRQAQHDDRLSFRSHEIATPTSRLAMTNMGYRVRTITQ